VLADHRICEQRTHIVGHIMIGENHRLTQSPRQQLSDIPQNNSRVDMDNIGITSLDQIAHRYDRQKRDMLTAIGGPLKRREAINPHFMLKAAHLTRGKTWRNNPDLVPAIHKINGQAVCCIWYTPQHRRILIRYNHYAHICCPFLYIEQNIPGAGPINRPGAPPQRRNTSYSLAGVSVAGASAASSAASSARSALVAAILAIPSSGSVIRV